MPLIRLIALAALFWLLYRLILALLQKLQPPTPRQRPRPHSDSMVRCELCGLHVPQDEALVRNGRYYCCKEHMDADEE